MSVPNDVSFSSLVRQRVENGKFSHLFFLSIVFVRLLFVTLSELLAEFQCCLVAYRRRAAKMSQPGDGFLPSVLNGKKVYTVLCMQK